MKKGISYLQTSKGPVIQLRGKSCNNILIKFGISMKLVKLIKMYLNGTHSSVWVGKMSDRFPIKKGLG